MKVLITVEVQYHKNKMILSFNGVVKIVDFHKLTRIKTN